MRIQHTVVFTLVHPVGSVEESAFLNAAEATLGSIDGVVGFTVNRQVSPFDDHVWQFSMVFADRAAYDAYTTDAAHVAFVEQRWQTEVRSFQEYDFTPR